MLKEFLVEFESEGKVYKKTIKTDKLSDVLDLFKKVELDTRIIDNIIYNYKDNIVTRRKIEKLVNNINHDGKPLSESMRFFEVIYK